MGQDNNNNKSLEESSEVVELGEAQKKLTYRYLGQRQGREDLDPIEVVEFEIVRILVGRHVTVMSSKAIEHLCHYKSHATAINDLKPINILSQY